MLRTSLCNPFLPVCHGSPFGGKIDHFQFWGIHDVFEYLIEFVKVCVGVNAVPIVSRHVIPFVIGFVPDTDLEVLAFPRQAAVLADKWLDVMLAVVSAAKDNRYLDPFVFENDCKSTVALVEYKLHIFGLGIVQAFCNAFEFECSVFVDADHGCSFCDVVWQFCGDCQLRVSVERIWYSPFHSLILIPQGELFQRCFLFVIEFNDD